MWFDFVYEIYGFANHLPVPAQTVEYCLTPHLNELTQ
jgi:hypothetical protein